MIVDEKLKLKKTIKVLRIIFIVLSALFIANEFRIVWPWISYYSQEEYTVWAIANFFLAVSFLMITLQTISSYRQKNAIITGVVNISSLLASLALVIFAKGNMLLLVLILLSIVISGIPMLRGRMLTNSESLTGINLRYVLLGLCYIERTMCWKCETLGSWLFDFCYSIISPRFIIMASMIGVVIAVSLLDGIWWCDSCNKKNKGKAKFCIKCGAPKNNT